MTQKNAVSARCRYYKYPAALAALDHANGKRNGFTNSNNVHWEHSDNNYFYYFHGADSCTEALDLMMQRHKEVTGKKVRVDNNVLFEHILCFSEEHYSFLESKYGKDKLEEAMTILIKRYCQAIKSEFGVEALGFDTHIDEGRYESNLYCESDLHDSSLSSRKNVDHEKPVHGKFVRNPHCHVQFINFDFDRKVAPLRGLLKKGKNSAGKTNPLNPNFEKIQDIAFDVFKRLGFERGVSRNITGRKHLKKEEFVKQNIGKLEVQAIELAKQNSCLIKEFEIKKQMFESVSSQVTSLQKQLCSLSAQVRELDALKHDMLEAINHGSEQALKDIATRKLTIPRQSIQ